MISSDLSGERLEQATRAWAPAVRFLEEAGSTNDVAMRWARQGAPEGCLVVADHQTAGRGRLGRTWFSAPGGCLLLSVVLRPAVPPEDLALINLAAAVAVCRAVAELGLEPRVKWPNDVILGGRKVAGILSEAEGAQGSSTTVVLGAGINVNVAREQLPEDLRETATSLAAEAGHAFDRLQLLSGFLGHFGVLYSGLGTGRPSPIVEAYRPLCETLGRRVRVETLGGATEGTAVDVAPTGGLVLDTGGVIHAGDVVHVA